MRSTICLAALCACFVITSCKKSNGFTKNHLDFSTDSILFDTVFTTVGSTTEYFRIYNNNSQPILIDDIQLMGGSASPYRINVDGVSGVHFMDIEIPPGDSLFCFVEVTLDVNAGTLPLVVSDSIRFTTNGSDQFVHLDAWGQDAYFHANEVVSGTWANDKPHVLYGTVAVGYPGIDSGLTLTIPAGTDIYCHKDAILIVYKSSIDIDGSLDNEVTFQGDRLESFYDDVAGQWWGIRLIEAQQSTIDYANIKNASVALQVDSTLDPLTLTLSNSIIHNSAYFGLNINAGANVTAENCLVSDAGLCCAYLFAGGEYHFKHCDFVNYWSGGRGGPAFLLTNWWTNAGITYTRDVVTSDFTNCVVYGNIADEWEVDTLAAGFVDFSVQNCLLAREEAYDYPNYILSLWNQIPQFTDPQMQDFHFPSTSPLNGNAVLTSVTSDLEGIFRSGSPDIGCYELP